jgi:hypothetical protein
MRAMALDRSAQAILKGEASTEGRRQHVETSGGPEAPWLAMRVEKLRRASRRNEGQDG